MEKNDYLKSSRPFGKAINYTAPKRVIRLQGQLNIDAGLVNQKWRLTLRRQLTSSVSTIFASTICVLVGYRQFQTNNRASRVICIKTCFADMLMFIVAKIRKMDTLEISKFS